MSNKWFNIPGFESFYQIDESFNIKRLYNEYYSQKTDKKIICKEELKIPKKYNLGYITITLFKKGIPTSTFLHRLIAITFIPNPENKPFVNHKNGIRDDNRIENLEWVTHKENLHHAWISGFCEGPHGLG